MWCMLYEGTDAQREGEDINQWGACVQCFKYTGQWRGVNDIEFNSWQYALQTYGTDLFS